MRAAMTALSMDSLEAKSSLRIHKSQNAGKIL